MYIAQGQGQTTPWGQNFDDNRKAFSLCPYSASFKWSLQNLILYTFSMILYMYIAPGQGQKTLWGQTLDVNRKPLSHLILYTFLMILYMYIAPAQGQKTLWGQTLDVNRKPLSLRPFVASFKQISEFWFYTHFLMFFHMYIAPGQGQATLCGQTPDVKRKKPCHFTHLLQVSKKYLWSLILYIIFHVFIHVYSPGAGAVNLLGSEFLCKHIPNVTLVICCKFLSLNDFLADFPI